MLEVAPWQGGIMPFVTWEKFLETLGSLRHPAWKVLPDGSIRISKNVERLKADPGNFLTFTPITAVTFVLTGRYYLPDDEKEAAIFAGLVPTTREEIIQASNNDNPCERRQQILKTLNL